MSKAYLVRQIERLRNAIAFNISCPQMLAYQRTMLASAEEKLAQITEASA